MVAGASAFVHVWVVVTAMMVAGWWQHWQYEWGQVGELMTTEDGKSNNGVKAAVLGGSGIVNNDMTVIEHRGLAAAAAMKRYCDSMI